MKLHITFPNSDFFKKKKWIAGGSSKGGGTFALIENGSVFEKVGVNISTVSGKFNKEFRKKLLEKVPSKKTGNIKKLEDIKIEKEQLRERRKFSLIKWNLLLPFKLHNSHSFIKWEVSKLIQNNFLTCYL